MTKYPTTEDANVKTKKEQEKILNISWANVFDLFCFILKNKRKMKRIGAIILSGYITPIPIEEPINILAIKMKKKELSTNFI